MTIKKILIPLCILGLISTVCLAGQSPGIATKANDEHRSYKAFKIDYVKGILEEATFTELSQEINFSKTVSKNDELYTFSLRSIRSPFNLYARPPPL